MSKLGEKAYPTIRTKRTPQCVVDVTKHEKDLAAAVWVEHPNPKRAVVGRRHKFLGFVDEHPTEGKFAAVYHPLCADCRVVLDGVKAQPGLTVTLGMHRLDHDGPLDEYACHVCTEKRRAKLVEAANAFWAANEERIKRNRVLFGSDEPTLDDVIVAHVALLKRLDTVLSK